ncbi:MAG: thioredoxin family protein [Gemmatimonadaceae bacterium]
MDDAMRLIRQSFEAGETFAGLLRRMKDGDNLLEALYKKASLSSESSHRASLLRGQWNLLVLHEDWCGDSVNVLPHLARLKEASSGIDLRIIGRDANPDIMNAHLTNGSRSIPVVIVLDSDFVERGWWGPRPGSLQVWATSEGLALPKAERYRQMRTWYARDRGATIVEEILAIIEQGEGADAKAAL